MTATAFLSSLAQELRRRGVPHDRLALETFVRGVQPATAGGGVRGSRTGPGCSGGGGSSMSGGSTSGLGDGGFGAGGGFGSGTGGTSCIRCGKGADLSMVVMAGKACASSLSRRDGHAGCCSTVHTRRKPT